MYQKLQTKAIVLKRLNYAEADRIITFFTPESGKLSAIAKAVRQSKSKLAGGVELFSICDIGLVRGRGELYTLTSSRLDKYFENIVKNYERLEVGYEALIVIDKLTDHQAGAEYYELLHNCLLLLDDEKIDLSVVTCWFYMQAMKINGSLPNLLQDDQGEELKITGKYGFSIEDGNFFSSKIGEFGVTEIKAWRVFQGARPKQLSSISGLIPPATLSADVLKGFVEFQL